jgi:hypothetical protein
VSDWVSAAVEIVLAAFDFLAGHFDTGMQALTLVACAIVIVRAEPAMNRMSRATLMTVRLAFYQLAVAAGAEVVAILVGRVPSWRETLMACGIATLMLCERRIRLLSRVSDRRSALVREAER